MLSRRRFLQLAGITAVSAAVSAAGLPLAAAPAFEPVYGRALDTLPVFAAPGGQPVAQLWSDTVMPLLGVSGEWYRLPAGYARREGVQPLLTPARRQTTLAAPPFWGSVTGAVAVVRAWCAAAAPIVTRVGHGGVLRIVDQLTEAGLAWYGVAESESGALLGWTQAAAWSPAALDQPAQRLTLALEQSAQRLTAYADAQPLLTAPVATGRDLSAGVYPLTEQRAAQQQADYHGAPWVLDFSGLPLSGAYWHNRFGQPRTAAQADPFVQVPPALAQWLYPRAAEIIVC